MSKLTRSPLKHTEGNEGHALMTKEAHIEAHGGDATAAGYAEVEEKVDSRPDYGYENDRGGWVFGKLGAKDPLYDLWLKKAGHSKSQLGGGDKGGGWDHRTGTYTDGSPVKPIWKTSNHRTSSTTYLPVNKENTDKKNKFYNQYVNSGIFNEFELSQIKANIFNDVGGTGWEGINYEKNEFNKWKLDGNGLITSKTKGGNYYSFSGNYSYMTPGAKSRGRYTSGELEEVIISPEYEAFINRQIDTGEWGFNPLTGRLHKLAIALPGLSEEEIDKRDHPEKYGSKTMPPEEHQTSMLESYAYESEEVVDLEKDDKLEVTLIDPFDVEQAEPEVVANNEKAFFDYIKINIDSFLSKNIAYAGDDVTLDDIFSGKQATTYMDEGDIFEPGTNPEILKRAYDLTRGEYQQWDSTLDELWYMFGQKYSETLPNGGRGMIKHFELNKINTTKDWERPNIHDIGADYNDDHTLKQNLDNFENLKTERGKEWVGFIHQMNKRGLMSVGDIADYWGISYSEAQKYYDFYYDPEAPIAKWSISPRDGRNQEHFVKSSQENFNTYTEDVIFPVIQGYLNDKDFEYSIRKPPVTNIIGQEVNAWEDIPKGWYLVTRENGKIDRVNYDGEDKSVFGDLADRPSVEELMEIQNNKTHFQERKRLLKEIKEQYPNGISLGEAKELYVKLQEGHQDKLLKDYISPKNAFTALEADGYNMDDINRQLDYLTPSILTKGLSWELREEEFRNLMVKDNDLISILGAPDEEGQFTGNHVESTFVSAMNQDNDLGNKLKDLNFSVKEYDAGADAIEVINHNVSKDDPNYRTVLYLPTNWNQAVATGFSSDPYIKQYGYVGTMKEFIDDFNNLIATHSVNPDKVKQNIEFETYIDKMINSFAYNPVDDLIDDHNLERELIKHLEIKGADIETYTKAAYVDAAGNEYPSEIDWEKALADFGSFSMFDGIVEDLVQYVKSDLDQDKTLMKDYYYNYDRATSWTPEWAKSYDWEDTKFGDLSEEDIQNVVIRAIENKIKRGVLLKEYTKERHIKMVDESKIKPVYMLNGKVVPEKEVLEGKHEGATLLFSNETGEELFTIKQSEWQIHQKLENTPVSKKKLEINVLTGQFNKLHDEEVALRHDGRIEEADAVMVKIDDLVKTIDVLRGELDVLEGKATKSQRYRGIDGQWRTQSNYNPLTHITIHQDEKYADFKLTLEKQIEYEIEVGEDPDVTIYSATKKRLLDSYDELNVLNIFGAELEKEYVINSKEAWDLLADEGYEWDGRAHANGRIYKLPYSVIMEHAKVLVSGDGGGTWVGRAAAGVREYNERDASVGHFGLLDYADAQDFGWWEYWATDEDLYASDDKSASFKAMIMKDHAKREDLVQTITILEDMLYTHKDPTSEYDDYWTERVADTWTSGLIVDNLAMGLGLEEGYHFTNDSKRHEMDRVQELVGDLLTEDQQRVFNRGVGMGTFEGVVQFAPVIAEFFIVEAGLALIEGFSLGTATPVVAPAMAAQAARTSWSISRFLRIGSKARKVKPVYGPKNMTFLQRLNPMKGGWAKNYYRNGRKLRPDEIAHLEKITGLRANTKAFDEAILNKTGKGRYIKGGKGKKRGKRGTEKRNWFGKKNTTGTAKGGKIPEGITSGANWQRRVGQFTYGALREELKMGIVFDEHYTPGGGVAFFGMGQMLAPAFRAAKFRVKPGAKYTGWQNPMNKILNVAQSATAGYLSVPLAKVFEGQMAEWMTGKEFEGFPEAIQMLTNQEGLINALVFGTIGIKGLRGPKGTNFKSYRKMVESNNELLVKTVEADIRMQKAEAEFGKDSPEFKKAAAEYNKLSQLRYNVQTVISDLNRQSDWNDVKKAEKMVKKQEQSIINALTKFNPEYKDFKVKYVNTHDQLTKDSKMVHLKEGKGAEINRKTKEITIDVANLEPGKLPHEFDHWVMLEMFKDKPELAIRLKSIIKESFDKGTDGQAAFPNQIKFDKNGRPVIKGGKVVREDMTLDQMIENTYGKQTERMSAMEYTAFTAELLQTPEFYDLFMRGHEKGSNVWGRIGGGIADFFKKNTDVDLNAEFANSPVGKKKVMQFLAEFAVNVGEGKLTPDQLKKFEKLANEITMWDTPIQHDGRMHPYEKTTMGSKKLRQDNLKKEDLQKERKLLNQEFVETMKEYNPVRDKEKIASLRERHNDALKDINKEIARLEKSTEESLKDSKFEIDIQNKYKDSFKENATKKEKSDAAFDIAQSYDPRITKSAGASRIYNELKKYEKLPEFKNNRDFILNDLLYDSNRSIRAEVLNYDITLKRPVTGYIGSILSKRGISESVEKFIKPGEGFKVEFDAKYVDSKYIPEPVIDFKMESKDPKGVILKDALKVKPEHIKQIENGVKDLDLNKVNFSNLNDLAPKLTKDLFGKGPQSRAEYIAENWKTIYDLLPKGAMLKTGIKEIEGLSTQIKPSVLKYFYKPTSRLVGEGAKASAKITGKTAGLPVQEKIPIKSRNEFLETIGLKIVKSEGLIKTGEVKDVVEFTFKKGSKEYRNVTETLFPGIIAETGRMVTNQVVRDLIKEGNISKQAKLQYDTGQLISAIKSGKSDIMASKEILQLEKDLKKLKHHSPRTILGVLNQDKYKDWKQKEAFINLLEKHILREGIEISTKEFDKINKILIKKKFFELGLSLAEGKAQEITTEKHWLGFLSEFNKKYDITLEYLSEKKQGSSIKELAKKEKFDLEYVLSHGRFEKLSVFMQDAILTNIGFGTFKVHGKRLSKDPTTSHGLSPKELRKLQKEAKEGFTKEDVTAELSEQVRRRNNINALVEYLGVEALAGKGKIGGHQANVYWPSSMGTLKLNIASLHTKHKIGTKDANVWDYIVESADLISGGKDYLKVYEANKIELKREFMRLFDLIDSGKIQTIEQAQRHIQAKTGQSRSSLKGLYTVTGLSLNRSKPTEDNKSGLHAEHEMMLFKAASTFFDMSFKNRGKRKKIEKELDMLIETMEQSIIEKELQTWNDSGEMNGPSGFPTGVPHHLAINAKMIWMTKGGIAENTIYLPASIKAGKPVTIAEYMKNNIAKNELIDLLNKVKEKNVSHIKLENSLIHEKNIELNRKNEISLTEAKFGGKISGSKNLSVEQARKIQETIDKASRLAKSKIKKRKGISVWDFDDTLATTKSGVRARVPNLSGKPKPGRKVVFLAGGAGSGKSNVVKKLGLEKDGFKIVNQDISLEWLKKNNGLPENMNDLTKAQLSTLGKLGHEARAIAKRKMMKFQGNAEGIVVDGTGGSMKAMEKLVKEFKEKGYDVSMLFVETSLETALQRNAARKERSLLDNIVIKNHEAVQGNKPGFRNMFKDRFMEVKTDKLKQEDAMPEVLVEKMNDFVRSYEKIRLDAEQFASEGKGILDRGGEFDFSEFNVVTGGQRGPFFEKALNRAKKFGTKDQFILTARPPAAQVAIHEFLKAQGLNIPIKNIKGLGNSTAEAKSLWMLERAAEGYNDFYFADDAMQNVRAVKDVLGKLDVKSKVVQAKSLNDVKNVNRLDSPNTYGDIMASKAHRQEYEKLISKHRPELVKEGLVSRTVDEMFEFIEGLGVPDNKKRKYERITTKWVATSNIKLKEDAYKVKDAVELAEKHKEDIFSYANPNRIIEKYAGKAKEKPTSPRTVKEFAKGTVTNKEHGITEHVVEETKEGMMSVRKVIDTHWGPKSNPWCITARSEKPVLEPRQYGYELAKTKQEAQARKQQLENEGFIVDIRDRGQNIKSKPEFQYDLSIKEMSEGPGIMEDAWQNWQRYSDGPKSIVFQNGRLLAFKANGQYWDRMDNPTDAPVIRIKEGRVTRTVELVPVGKNKVEEFVMETRTVSKDKKTVTTEIFVEKEYSDINIHPEGTKIVENRVNGITIKETVFHVNGNKRRVTEFTKDGKAITTRTLDRIDGKINSINNGMRDKVRREGELTTKEVIKERGDIIAHEIRESATGIDYWYGKALINGKVTEIGFKTPKGFEDIMSVMKTVDGKLRVDLNKLREIDPDVKGLPKEVVKPEGMRALEPVKNVLDQIDMKSETQQDIMGSKDILNREFNKMIFRKKGKGFEEFKKFSSAEAELRGKKRKWELFPSSADDFLGLMYNFLGKGKQGDKDMKFFEDNLMEPFAKGINDLTNARQKVVEDYSELIKYFPKSKVNLRKKIDGTSFTKENAIRVYLWNKAGYEIPGMSASGIKQLVKAVEKDPNMLAFAEQLSFISRQKQGYVKPGKSWLGGNIAFDLYEMMQGKGREAFLESWKENKDIIFSKENMNKIEAAYGTKFRETLEDVLYRMENGTNRNFGNNRFVNGFANFMNNSTAGIMFMNMRSSVLQTISNINYINWSFNNPLRAGLAFANLPQYIKDFAFIFNSNMLKQRRSGLRMNINEAELAAALVGQKNKAKAMLGWLLKKGFLPTQIADSFAISSGGATWYRNRIKNLIKKEGLSKEAAEKKAWLEFQEITERTQQSSRPDLISQQQASPMGRFILAFANTPMQYARIQKKAMMDIANGRGDLKHNISKLIYYSTIQSAIFAGLQSALFAAIGDPDEEEMDKKKERVINTMIDSQLVGLFGFGGRVSSQVKNAILEYLKQDEYEHDDSFMTRADHTYTLLQLLNISPPFGSKFRKLYSSIQTERFNEEVIKERGFHLDNPALDAFGNLLAATTNIPLDRVVRKIQNLQGALNTENETWQRIALALGWSQWDVGVEDPDIVKTKEVIKEKKKEEKKEKEKIKKEEKEKKIEDENKVKEERFLEDQKKEIEDGKEDVKCAAVSKKGVRCKTKTEPGQPYCTIHTKVEKSESGEKVQCKKIKSNKERCKMKTNSKSGLCYYHD